MSKRSAPSHTSVDVVIPTYNNAQQLAACLASLAASATRLRALICVDGSTDGTTEVIERLRDSLPFPLLALQHPDGRNHGRAAARNLALLHLEAPFTLLLDSDMRLAPDALEQHLRVLRDRECVSVGSVKYDNANRNLWARYLETRGANRYPAGAVLPPVSFVTANSALPTALLTHVGGFDETLTSYGGEDTELGLRLGKAGIAFVNNPAARASTTEEKSVESALAALDTFARTNLPVIRGRHPDGPAIFWTDRVTSTRLSDRLVRGALNPLADAIVDGLLPRTPFLVQRHLLNYKVARTVFRAYEEATS